MAANSSMDASYAYDTDYVDSEADPVAAIGSPALVVMAEENCTLLYGNVSNAVREHNVTCLGHAPTLSQQVRFIV